MKKLLNPHVLTRTMTRKRRKSLQICVFIMQRMQREVYHRSLSYRVLMYIAEGMFDALVSEFRSYRKVIAPTLKHLLGQMHGDPLEKLKNLYQRGGACYVLRILLNRAKMLLPHANGRNQIELMRTIKTLRSLLRERGCLGGLPWST